jgi:hypothetical protein
MCKHTHPHTQTNFVPENPALNAKTEPPIIHISLPKLAKLYNPAGEN